MKKLLIGLTLLTSVSSFASDLYTINSDGACVLAYGEESRIAVKPIMGNTTPYGGLVKTLEIKTENEEKVVYEIFGKNSTDNVFKRTSGDALSEYLIYDDYRGLAFFNVYPKPIAEANGATFFNSEFVGDQRVYTLACEKGHGGQRHGMR